MIAASDASAAMTAAINEQHEDRDAAAAVPVAPSAAQDFGAVGFAARFPTDASWATSSRSATAVAALSAGLGLGLAGIAAVAVAAVVVRDEAAIFGASLVAFLLWGLAGAVWPTTGNRRSAATELDAL